MQTSNWNFLKNFISDIVSDADVDTGNTRFALSFFNHMVYDKFFLNTYNTKADILRRIATIASPVLGGTDIALAIRMMVYNTFTEAHGDRDNAPDLAIIITDGRSNNNAATVSNATRAKGMGIHMIAVGVGFTDTSGLNQIASEPVSENVFTVNEYSELLSIESLIAGIFYENCTGTYVSSYYTIYLFTYY